MTIDEAIALARENIRLGDRETAKRLYLQVLSQFPNSKPAAEGLKAMGVDVPFFDERNIQEDIALIKTYIESNRLDEAHRASHALIKKFPRSVVAFGCMGELALRLDRVDEAVSAFQKAVELAPNNADLQKNLADCLRLAKRSEEAIEHYRLAIRIRPKYIAALNNLGVTLSEVRRYSQAEACFHEILSQKPDNTSAYNNLAVTSHDKGDHNNAAIFATKALEINPNFVPALNNLGNSQMGIMRFQEAIKSYGKALELEPKNFELRSKMMLCMARICDWEPLEREKRIVLEHLSSATIESAPPNPWAWLGIFDAPEVHKIVSTMESRGLRHRPDLGPILRKSFSKKIRVGYFSADYHNHPTTRLIVELFERHDRNHFEIHAFSFGPDSDPKVRDRVVAGVDKFHKVDSMTDKEVAILARSLELDIAVDLNGFTANRRTGIFAYRAAPVQVSYLGYPSTMGMEDMDYVIADKTVIPEEQRKNFTEAVAYMPVTYQVNVSSKEVAIPGPSRTDCELPDKAFVFCCFNSSYKITGELFDIWMRLLSRIENSVLWLFMSNQSVDERIRKAAQKRGVSGSRIIFANRLDHSDHLARHQHADLFLDTLPYNAHTTASDALWTGLPIVTMMGNSFASRVAASLLKAIEVPELIAETPEAYESLALRLATDTNLRKNIADKILRNRETAPLFDTVRFTRDLEAIYQEMHSRSLKGEFPDVIEG
jgi:protein O-GlcNAc transferase